MADSRHKHSAPRVRRRRSVSRSILPTVGLLTLVAAGAAVVVHEDDAKVTAAPQKQLVTVSLDQDPSTISRSAERAPLPNEAAAEDKVRGKRFAVVALDIHAAAKKSSPVLATVDAGDTVDITGVKKAEWAQIIHKGLPRWVLAKGLAKEMPLGTSPCASGSAVESGLQPDTIKVHRAVCAAFPSISRYGGVSGGGEHATGQALDIMVSDPALGDQIAAFLQKHRAELGIEYLIWQQRIWRPSTSDSWRPMSDRGSPTANHMDHVHVTTYGDAAQ